MKAPNTIDETDKDYIGRYYADVDEELKILGIKHRCVNIDGVTILITQDVNFDRLNFTIKDNIIIAVRRG